MMPWIAVLCSSVSWGYLSRTSSVAEYSIDHTSLDIWLLGWAAAGACWAACSSRLWAGAVSCCSAAVGVRAVLLPVLCAAVAVYDSCMSLSVLVRRPCSKRLPTTAPPSLSAGIELKMRLLNWFQLTHSLQLTPCLHRSDPIMPRFDMNSPGFRWLRWQNCSTTSSAVLRTPSHERPRSWAAEFITPSSAGLF